MGEIKWEKFDSTNQPHKPADRFFVVGNYLMF